MTDLEKYIRDNAAAFDTESPAEGHEARFRVRLFFASFRTRLSSFRTAIRNLRPAPVLAFAIAACAALLLVIRPGDPFRGVANNPEAIYLAYMDRVADLYQVLPMEDEALQEITEEAEPLFTQLPENLSNRERSRILRSHYGELLAAARQLKKQ